MVVKINNKSDFKINEWSESIALEVPFEFVYYIPLNKEKYVASYDGHSYINCVRLADGSLDVIFNNHGLGIGRLKVVRKYFVDDLSFADGVFDVISDDQTDVFLTSGKTFDTYVKTLVVPPYLKGDKGDPMTWETMTEKERGELVKDIAEAIDPEMVMTENEKLRQEAEQGRQTAEQQRSTTFNTLKGEMQSAITAGNAAARNAQKVVDEYDEKVSEQDSKLTELGSYIGKSEVKNFRVQEGKFNRTDGSTSLIIPVFPNCKIEFKKGAKLSYYIFIKSYSDIDIQPDYAEGFSGIGKQVGNIEVYAPSDANYLIVLLSVGEADDRSPEAILVEGVETRVPSVDVKISTTAKSLNEKIDNVVAELDTELDTELYYIEDYTNSNHLNKKGYVNYEDGSIITDSVNYVYHVFEAEQYCKFRLNTEYNNVAGVVALVAFYSSTDINTDTYLGNKSVRGIIGKTDYIVRIPSDAKIAIVSINKAISPDSVISCYVKKGLKNKISEFDSAALEDLLSGIELNKYAESGVFKYNAYEERVQLARATESIKYEVYEGEAFLITGEGGVDARLWTFITKEGLRKFVSPANIVAYNKIIVAPSDGYLVFNHIVSEQIPKMSVIRINPRYLRNSNEGNLLSMNIDDMICQYIESRVLSFVNTKQVPNYNDRILLSSNNTPAYYDTDPTDQEFIDSITPFLYLKMKKIGTFVMFDNENGNPYVLTRDGVKKYLKFE